jgi:ADP-heptose:LPS heptosyltransferase
MAVVLSLEGHSLTSDILSHLSGAKYVLGSDRFIFSGCTRNFFYNLISPTSENEIHQTERNMELMRYIGADSPDLEEWIFVDESERNMIKKEFYRQYPNLSGPFIGLHIGANKVENRWSINKFSELAQILYAEYNMQIILFWGPKEKQLAEQFLSYIQFKPIAIKPTTLRKLALYYTLCDGLVCNDTGPMHLCAAVGTPLISVFGPTNPIYWKPPGDRFVAIRGENHCVQNVTVTQVLKALLNLLND